MPSLENRLQSTLTEENYNRSLFPAVAYFFMGLTIYFYYFRSVNFFSEMRFLAFWLCLFSLLRLGISYLGIKKKIDLERNTLFLKITVIFNALLWGAIFSLVAFEAPLGAPESWASLAIITGICSACPTSLIAMPRIQRFFYICTVATPAIIYTIRFFTEEPDVNFIMVPILLMIFYFYFTAHSQKLRKMLIQSVEYLYKLEIEQKNLKQALRELKDTQKALFQEKAKSLNAERLAFLGSMASGVAHEINTPVRISMAQVSKINSSLDMSETSVLTKTVSTGVAVINEMNYRIRDILHGLQLFARDNENENFSVVTLEEVIKYALTFVDEKISNLGIAFYLDPFPHGEIRCQKSQIVQVFIHLLTNAMQAVENSVIKEIRMGFQQTDGTIRISVTDTGEGIRDDIKDRIFDPFFTTKKPGKNTGLGLSVASGIVEIHQGQISFTSEAGLTTFTLELPLVETRKTELQPSSLHLK